MTSEADLCENSRRYYLYSENDCELSVAGVDSAGFDGITEGKAVSAYQPDRGCWWEYSSVDRYCQTRIEVRSRPVGEVEAWRASPITRESTGRLTTAQF